jgi:ADP-heptose:LPS heptosyltransferase
LPLAQAGTLVDEVCSVDDLPLHAGFMRHLPKDHRLRRFLCTFDLIISWFGDREGRWEQTLRRACTGTWIVQPYHEVHAFEGHVSDFYLQSLAGLGLHEQSGVRAGQPREPILRDVSFSGPQPPGDGGAEEGSFLCLHPGSGSTRKNWAREAFLEVAHEAFHRWRLPSIVLIGPAETNQLEFWTKAEGPSLSVKEGLPILEVAGTLRRAAFYVGNDSGITHMAAAMGVPAVALFGPTDPARWAPRGKHVQVLLQPITPEQVLSSLKRSLGYPTC